MRVERSTGRVRPKPWAGERGGGGGGGRDRGGRGGGSYNPNDRCYECGESGHYAYDCRFVIFLYVRYAASLYAHFILTALGLVDTFISAKYLKFLLNPSLS